MKERSAIARFKVKDEDAYILAWTTTPWTLPSNVALCVNPNETYAKVKAADGFTYYMAEALLDTVLADWPIRRRERLPMRCWKSTRARIWNTKNMCRCLTARWKPVKDSIKKRSM